MLPTDLFERVSISRKEGTEKEEPYQRKTVIPNSERRDGSDDESTK